MKHYHLTPVRVFQGFAAASRVEGPAGGHNIQSMDPQPGGFERNEPNLPVKKDVGALYPQKEEAKTCERDVAESSTTC